MPFDFVTAASDLDTYLVSRVPATWRVLDAAKITGATSGIALTYTQGDVHAALGANLMPPGTVVVDFVLILSAPETDQTKGMARLSREAPALWNALDSHPQLDWSDAERGVLDTGESIYLIPLKVIATYDTTQEN